MKLRSEKSKQRTLLEPRLREMEDEMEEEDEEDDESCDEEAKKDEDDEVGEDDAHVAERLQDLKQKKRSRTSRYRMITRLTKWGLRSCLSPSTSTKPAS